MRNILEVKNLVRSYNTATFRDSKNNVNVLKGISFQVAEGEFVGIMGKSGCGKTTLLKTLGMIDKPTDGTIKFMGEDTSELYGDKLADIRNSKIGFIFQDFYLMDSLSVEENIMLPMIISKQNINKMIAEAKKYAEQFQIEHLLKKNPYKLSGGEKRRLNLLRVLMEAPNVLILDEPTNDLDIETMTILEDYLDDFDGIVITVSHDRYFLDRIVTRIFAFEENGAIRQYEGGYTDYVKKRSASTENSFDGKTKSHTGNKEARIVYKNREKKLKFSYQEQREYETIEEDISVLETTIETLDQEMAENGTDYVKLRELSEKKDEAEEQLMEKMERWEYLEELAEKIANQ